MQAVPITVLMCAYNVEAYIAESIQSILDQTFSDFEFLIFDDCSSDKTVEIIQSFSDPRIRLIRNTENIGLTRGLNEGIKLARGGYIARMDADDLSFPDRLQRQFNFMEKNPEIGLCGCWYQSFGAKNKVVRYETEHQKIALKLLYQTQFCHAAAFMRKSVLTYNSIAYDTSFITAQDYELWTRLQPVCKLANIPEVLFAVRYHEKSISVVKKTQQWENHYRIMRNQFKNMGIDASNIEIALFIRLCNGDFDFTNSELSETATFLRQLVHANGESLYIPQDKLNYFLREKWFHLCYQTVANGSYKLYKENEDLRSTEVTIPLRLKFYVRSWMAK
jgi:glycosyltransferase involved in cell wall biosynthesis